MTGLQARTPIHDLLQPDRLLAMSRAAVIVCAVLMPLYVVRFRFGPLPTTLLEVAILITVAVYAVTVLFGEGPRPGRTPYEIPIALFLVAGVIGIFVAPDHRGALGIFRAYLVEPIAVFYIAIAVFRKSEDLVPLLAGLGVATALYCAIDVATFLLAVRNGSLVPGHAQAAFQVDPNSVALYVEPLIGLATGLLFFGSARLRVPAAVVLAALLVAELATLSRGGLLAIATVVFIAIITLRVLWVRVVLLVGAVAGAAGVVRLPFLGLRVQQSLDPVSGSLFTRERVWVATIHMLRDHPVFGAGINAYQSVMAPYRASDPNQVPEPYPHNIVLTSWTELGVLGVLAFLWILGGLMIQPWRAFGRATGIDRALLWGTGAAFAMIAVHGLVDSPYWKNDLSLEFWLLAALQVVSLRTLARPSAS